MRRIFLAIGLLVAATGAAFSHEPGRPAWDGEQAEMTGQPALIVGAQQPGAMVSVPRLSSSIDPSDIGLEQAGTILEFCPYYVLCPWHSIYDHCPAGGAMDDNGYLEKGETGSFTIFLRNVGNSPATGVSATISTTTPGATILSGTSTFPDIPPGGVAESSNGYAIITDQSFSGCYIAFSVVISAHEGTWSYILNWSLDSGHCPNSGKNFEVWPPSGWTFPGDGTSIWETNLSYGDPNNTGGRGQCAEAEVSLNDHSPVMRTPVINLFGYDIGYKCNFQSTGGGATADTDISLNGGITWINVHRETASDPNGHQVYISIYPYSGMAVMVRFLLFPGNGNAIWQVDEFLAPPGCIGPAMPPPPPCHICSAGPPPPPCDDPGQAQLVAPQNGITGAGTEVPLSWIPADFSDYYEVYAGPRMGQLSLMGTTTDTAFLITGLSGATYYEWMVSAVNECGFKHSRVWSFTTAGGEDDSDHSRPLSPP